MTSLSPASGATAGGTTVTITGGGFTGTTGAGGVKFGATNASSYTVDSNTQITAVSPAGSSGTVDVTVTNTGATSTTGVGDHFTYMAPLVYAPSSPPSGTVGAAYSQSLASASGGTGSYSYAASAGLPAGVTLAANGTLSGTPTEVGTFNFTVTVTDSASQSQTSGTLSLVIAPPTITVSPVSPSLTATVASAYSGTFTASGGTASYSYAVTGGALPAGLSLSSGGTLSGTPTAGGTFNFTVTATDSTSGAPCPCTGSGAYTLTVNPPTITVAPASLSAVAAGAAASGTFSASGGISAYTYAVTAGALPAGVSLSSGGTLSGAPTAVGTFNFTVTATDSSTGAGPYPGSRAYTWQVNPPVLAISPASGASLSGTALTAFSQTFAASGGTAPYSYGITVNSGSMPAGLSFNTGTGTLSGTPAGAGMVSFTIVATDSTTGSGSPFSVAGTYNLTIGAPAIAVAPGGSVPNPVIGTAYSQTFTASGGTAPYDFAVSAGTLPAGLTFNPATGVLSGTPTAAGSFNFTVQATDASHFTGTQSYSIVIAGAVIAVAPASLPGGSTGVAYSQSVSASGGTAPYGYAVTVGTLPTGLSLDPATGALTGTPTTVNSYNFTIKATDSSTGTGAPFFMTQAYTVAIASGNADLSGLALSSGTLSPAFGAGTLAYTAQVANGDTAVTVTLALADAGATATVNGNPPATAVPLALGPNTVTVLVTAPDGVTQKTYTVTVTRPGLHTATGAGTTLDIANASAACTLATTQFTPKAGLAGPQQSSLPTGYTYPYPAVDFKAEQCASNSDLTVTLTFPGTVPAGAVLLKYDATAVPPWQSFAPTSVSGNQVTYTIHDGGALDEDKAVNGEFLDPVILAAPLPAGAQGIPALDRWALALLGLLVLCAARSRMAARRFASEK